MNAQGNTILITGGASGIGFALSRLLMASGNRVIVCGRYQSKLEAAMAQLPGLTAIHADVADRASRNALVRVVRERFPNLNVLINNAGVVHVSDLTKAAHIEELETEIAVNLMAPVELTNDLLPLIRAHSKPTIINVTTGYVFLPSARTAPYSATKTALHVYTRSLRYQLARHGVHVVEVMPPPVDTAMASHYPGSKVLPEFAARKILKGLVNGDDEIVIGLARVARILGRLIPATAFTIMNRTEEKS